ncbi:hypothetical protein BCV69DRAFT_295511 [Microstroma glucosiphilum]|uniref:Uncharacterized protein n=1 Tax=Pseudomicrostroma glucosiphilum TaxID=1684307 RepID=A0A316TY33_9BASI|nr:hypothetical protein BCV69DRAFT_295511 [Pseudomicrostroma glucosiphilum]PWN18097.1 hypothetical protein BCV69DRAFT_295511 [Pseudomicrostroma glucosiphilum]
MVRQPNQGELLKQIRAIRTSQDEQQCQSSECMRQDFDDLGQWTLAAKHLAATTQNTCLAALLDQDTQSLLTQLFWDKLDHERSSVAKRSESVLPTVLLLLDQIALGRPSPSKVAQSSGGRAPLSHLASLLLDRASQDMETRTALVIYDNLLSLYDAEEVLKRTPDLYSQLINKFSAQVDIPTRRSRVCMKIVRRKGEAMGLRFDSTEEAVASKATTSQAAMWSEWVEYTTRPIIDALQSEDSYRRTSTSVYHLVELFQLAPASISAVLAGLMQQAPALPNLPAVLATLRAGKGYGLCRVGESAETSNETLLGEDLISATRTAALHPSDQLCIVIPAALLAACGQSSDEELQVSAFSLVVETRSAVSPLTKDELALLQAFLEASFSSTHASGRGSLHSLFGKLLARITAVGYAAEREIAKIKDDAEPEKLRARENHQLALQSSRDFLLSVTNVILRTLHPGAPYHIVIASLTFLELILAAGVDPQYERSGAGDTDPGLKATFGTFRKEYSLGVRLIDGRMVKILLSCADSTYPDIQARALGLLHRFPAPLHGLEDQVAAERAILLKARRLLLSGRDSESSAAGGLLRVYQQVYIRRLGWTPTPLLKLEGGNQSTPTVSASSRELLLFSDLLAFLEAHIKLAETEGLFEAAKNNPLHGTLITLQRMLDDAVFWSAIDGDVAGQQELRAEFVRAQALIDRIWDVTRPILCAAAPEGNDHSGAADIGGGDDAVDAADTEVARALAAAEGGALDDAMTETIIRKSQVMLSYSWRGMKEAAALLGKLVSSPLKHDANIAKAVWTEDEIQQAGDRFSLWMTAVRHRGAFSTIYPAYSSAAAAIVRGDWLEVKELPKKWLQSFIFMITDAKSSISTTRRSAGIGYAVLALVTALPLRQDRAPLQSAMKRLIDAADECFGSEDPKSVAAHIHTINILRVLVLDASLAEPMSPFTDTLLSLAIRRFQSPVWYIRNAGLMLFAALSPRAFPARKTNEDAPSSQLPANRFFQLYPTLHPALKDHLDSALKAGLHKASNRADAEQAGSLYAVLFLLSRMQAVDHQESGAADIEGLRKLVGQCLESVDFKIREIASRAYSSLTTRTNAAATALDLVNTCHFTKSENSLHGSLLAVARLGRTHGVGTGHAKTAQALKVMPGIDSSSSPAVQEAYKKAVAIYADAQQTTESDKVKYSAQDLVLRRRQVLWGSSQSVTTKSLGSSPNAQADESFIQPIIDSLFSPGLNNPTQRIMNQCFYGLFATLLSLLIGTGGNPHVLFLNVVAVCLWASVNWFVAELARMTPPPSSDDFTAGTADFQLRSEAADELYEGYDEATYLSGLSTVGTTLEEEWDRLASVAFESGRVPLRESALTLLGCLTTSLLQTSSDADYKKKALVMYSKLVCLCAKEDEHVESRLAAIQSLARCGRWLFSPSRSDDQQLAEGAERALFNARVAVVDLLQDDEEEVRYIAAELISKAISASSSEEGAVANGSQGTGQLEAVLQAARQSVASSSISTARAWEWMDARYTAPDGKDLWTRHLCRTVMLPSDRGLSSSLEEALHPADVLFAVERPNLYRDVEMDVLQALAVLESRKATPSRRYIEEWFGGRADAVTKMAGQLLEKEESTISVVGRVLAVRLYAAAILMGKGRDDVERVRKELGQRLRYTPA